MLHRYSVVLLVVLTARAAAQPLPQSSATRRTAALVLPGDAWDDARRREALVAADGGSWSMIRTSTLAGGADTARRGWAAAIAPMVTLVHHTALPTSRNDGSLWAGRGISYRVIAGAAASRGPLHIVLAPELAFTQNREIAIVASGDSSRSAFASPWHDGVFSADLPLRFGAAPLTILSPGQSRIELRGRRLATGVSSEDQWWGPGIRNALVLSNNAAGIPHAYVRTARPLHTRLGDVEARFIAGTLTESIYFDRDARNDRRSISGAAATLRPAAEPGLIVGVARVVYAPLADRPGGLARAAFDVATRWQRPADSSTSRGGGPSEQLLSLFARWAIPGSGAEVYGEWARQRLPRSLRALLVAPQRSSGFTAGLQAARPALAGVLRGQLEVTTLEQLPRTLRGPVESFYTSAAIPQGYTQRGQSVGAAIGPGASSQWVAADYSARRWEAGVNFGRVRTQNDAYYQQPSGIERHAHDVSLMTGARGGTTLFGVALRVELVRTHRLNYLFENVASGYVRDDGNDVYDRTLRVSARVAP